MLIPPLFVDYCYRLRNPVMSDSDLPFNGLDSEEIRAMVNGPLFSSEVECSDSPVPIPIPVLSRRAKVVHDYVGKREVLALIRSLHPYPEITGYARAELNAADQIPFDLFRIPRVGHCPKGIMGKIFKIPMSRIQSPLAFELLGPGKEITIDSWPEGSVSDDSISISPERSCFSASEDVDEVEELSIPSTPPPKKKSKVLVKKKPKPLLSGSSQASGASKQSSSSSADSTSSRNSSRQDISQSIALMIARPNEETEGTDGSKDTIYFDSKVYTKKLVERTDSLSSVSREDLPPIEVFDIAAPFVVNPDSFPTESQNKVSVRDNGSIRFVVVSRAIGTEMWVVPTFEVTQLVVNQAINYLYKHKREAATKFEWVNQWRNLGLLSIVSTSIELLEYFRSAVASVALVEYEKMEFNTYPRDCVPCSEVTCLLKSNLRNLDPECVAPMLMDMNQLYGSLRLDKSQNFDDGSVSLKGECKDDWRVITLVGDQVFFESLNKFPESHPFILGCGHTHIRGGTGRPSTREVPIVKSQSISKSKNRGRGFVRNK